MSDWSIIKHWWSGLTEHGSTAFLAATPPTRERYTQDEGHEDAAEQLAAEGLPGSTAYAVWHWQAHRFDRSGRLAGSNPIYFGGDRAVVAAKLATVPDGFRIDGGRSDQEAFLLAKVRDLSVINPASDPEASHLLADLTGWHPAPRTDEELAWCRRAVATRGATAQTRRQAFGVLYDDDALTDDVLDVALAEAADIWDDPRSTAVNMLAAALLQSGRPDGPGFVDQMLSTTPDLVTPGVLELRGGADALQVAHRRAEQGVDVDTYLRLAAQVHGRDIRGVAIELAEQTSTNDEARRALARAIPRAIASPESSPLSPDLQAEVEAALRLVEDDSVPAQLRADIADAHDFVPARLTERLDALPADTSPAIRQQLHEQHERWERAIERLRASGAAERWRGIDLSSPTIRRRDQESGATLTKPQLEWYREKLFDESLTEPELGFCLGKVLDANAVTHDDLDRLLRGWKKRFAKAPDTYDKHRPGLVSLGIALAETAHPEASKFFDGVRGLKPKWARAPRNVLLGWYGSVDDLPDLWVQVLKGENHAAVGWSMIRARLDGTRIAAAADEGIRLAIADDARPYVARHLVIAAVAWGDPVTRLWHYSFDDRSRPWFDRALEVSQDTNLSSRIRRLAHELAAGHHLIEYPDQLTPPASAAEVEQARTRLAAAGATIGD